MRIAVVSDTHLPKGSRTLPEACVERLRLADTVLHGGDLTSPRFLAELRALGRPVHAVHGNRDEEELRRLLPREVELELGGVRIALLHDGGPRAGRAARLAARFPGCSAVVYGHSHLPEVASHGATWILNPGSPTERRRAPEPTMLELRVEGDRIEPELVGLGGSGSSLDRANGRSL